MQLFKVFMPLIAGEKNGLRLKCFI